MEIKSVFMKPKNLKCFRYDYPKYPLVIGAVNLKPSKNLDFRLCYEVVYDDGFIDYVPMSEVGLAFELVTEQKEN